MQEEYIGFGIYILHTYRTLLYALECYYLPLPAFICPYLPLPASTCPYLPYSALQCVFQAHPLLDTPGFCFLHIFLSCVYMFQTSSTNNQIQLICSAISVFVFKSKVVQLVSHVTKLQCAQFISANNTATISHLLMCANLLFCVSVISL